MEAQYATAKANLRRIKDLVEQDLMSQKDLDEAVGTEQSAGACGQCGPGRGQCRPGLDFCGSGLGQCRPGGSGEGPAQPGFHEDHLAHRRRRRALPRRRSAIWSALDPWRN